MNLNDVIYAMAKPYADGSLYFPIPINDGVPSNTSYLSSFDGRTGLADFSGTGANINVGQDLLNKDDSGYTQFSFSSWVYIDTWTENSYIFKKENSSTQKVNLKLGNAATNRLYFELADGADNHVYVENTNLAAGSWHHVTVSYKGNLTAYNQAHIYIDGVDQTLTYKNGDGLLPVKAPFIRDDIYLGADFDGKMDEVSFSQFSRSSGEVRNAMNSEIVIDSWNETKISAYWKFDDAADLGKDSRTWLLDAESIKSKYDDYSSMELQAGIYEGQWKTIIETASLRASFAATIADLLTAYPILDGIDLDFEWCSAPGAAECWDNYSTTMVEIDNTLAPEDVFSVTLHPIFYNVTSAAIAAVDFFGMQCYGPYPGRYPYEQFVSDYDTFIAYGYPKDKLVMGVPFYGTSTDGLKKTFSYFNIVNAYPNLDPALDIVIFNGNESIFNGYNTIRNKSQFIRDNKLAGIMVFDSGTDVEYSSDLCLLRAVNEVLNANVDSVWTEADAVCSNNPIDTDGDGICDSVDNCVNIANPGQEDLDSDGIGDVCDEDVDGDNIINNLDTCPNTPTGGEVDANGCILLASDNFNIEIISESCPNRNNGQIRIEAQTSYYNYKATINETDYNFTTNKTIVDLEHGNYELCITIMGDSFEQCYEIEIGEGVTISGKSNDTSNRTTIEILEGTAPFGVFVNKHEVLKTQSSTFDLDVKHGDFIEVKSSKDCEGVYSKTIDLFDKIKSQPNPTTGIFEVLVPLNLKEVPIEIYNSNSQLIRSKIYPVIFGKVQLDVNNQTSGVYFVKVLVQNPVTLKVIKNNF